MTRDLQAHADQWRNIAGLSDQQASELIRLDQIDILIDLALHTGDNRLLVFARKPAPVQVTYLGCNSTTGLATIDYRITDPYFDPPDSPQFYSEQSIRLPETTFCYQAHEAAPDVGPLPSLSAGHLTFGCLNNFSKVSAPTLDAWISILKAVPNSRLILHPDEGRHRQQLLDHFAGKGVERDRVSFIGRVSRVDYFRAYHSIDIALDPFPYNGVTTTCDALWMGVPVISLSGETCVGRAGLSILSNVGLNELVAHDLQGYIKIAAELANDRPRLQVLRSNLRDRMHRSPLMDAPRFARNLEAAYRDMWRKWSAQFGPMTSENAIRQKLQSALQHHRAGHPRQAEDLYGEILALHPGQPDTLHLLGLLAHLVGQNESGLDLITRAIGLEPDQPDYHCNLGIIFYSLDRFEEAAEELRRTIGLDADNAEAHNNLGNALERMGKLKEAAEAFQQAVTLKSDSALALNNLGNVLNKLGRTEPAIAACQKAIALKPDYAEGFNNLANALHNAGELDDAIAAYEHAILLNPELAEAYSNLGSALYDARKLDQAIAACKSAIKLKPDYMEALGNLGNALKEAGRLDEAIDCYQRAVALQPGSAEAHNNFGNAILDNGQLDEAIVVLRRAIELNPELPDAHLNLGNALKSAGELDQAVASYRQGCSLNPDFLAAQSNYLFSLHYHPGYDAAAIYQEHLRWRRQVADPLKVFIKPHTNDSLPDRRLKIGFVSADFCAHPVGSLLLPLFESRDRCESEVFCYANMRISDDITLRLQAQADQWRNIFGLSDEKAAELIRQDQIDILVDLSLHTGKNRLLIFARKPAPVQVTYLGTNSTTGLDTIDYRITDRFFDPPGVPQHYSEQSIWLPETTFCFHLVEPVADVNELPVLSRGYITFGCLNNFSKVSQPALEVWASLLKSVPKSRLMLLPDPGSHRQRIQKLFAENRVDPDRLIFTGRLPRADYFKAHNDIDIALDSFPYGGVSTSCGALWMGVPIVSLAGNTAVSRAGLCILTNIGLPELVARTEQDYIKIAVGLANDLPRLTELRSTLRGRLQNSVLMDASRFARNMEIAFRTMWRDWCKKQH